MKGIAVFAYGSLVDPVSAARTLGRQVSDVVPARLEGWRRRWSQARDNLECEKTFALADGSLPPFVLGLNVEQQTDPGEAPNGVLIAVSEDELAALDLRELRYDRVDVTGGVADAGFEQVFTYTAKPANLALESPPGAVVLATYAQTVERAFAALGPAELERFRATTGPTPVEVVKARLVRDRIPAGNPREW